MLPIELESTNFKFGSWVVACNVLVDIEVRMWLGDAVN